MKKLIITISLLFVSLLSNAQNKYGLKTLKIDINNNGIQDVIKPFDEYMELKIDNKKYKINYENDLGFEITEIEFSNNVIIISGGTNGTGAWSFTYKFRYNKLKNKIELIGYEDFSKWVSGNRTTSINLINNKYEVTVMEWNERKQDHDISVFKGKKNFKKIYLTELRNADFEIFSAVGQQYEN